MEAVVVHPRGRVVRNEFSEYLQVFACESTARATTGPPAGFLTAGPSRNRS